MKGEVQVKFRCTACNQLFQVNGENTRLIELELFVRERHINKDHGGVSPSPELKRVRTQEPARYLGSVINCMY